MNTQQGMTSRQTFYFGSFLILAFALLQPDLAYGQAVIGVIENVIQNMVILLNVIIIGLIAWSGFLLARGDGSAVQRIIYGIIGLVVLNSARAIIQFFV